MLLQLQRLVPPGARSKTREGMWWSGRDRSVPIIARLWRVERVAPIARSPAELVVPKGEVVHLIDKKSGPV